METKTQITLSLMSSVLDSIRSVQETVERIAKQTGTEHLFGNIGYILGLEDIDGKSKSKSTEKTQKADTANTSNVSVDAPNASKSQPESKSVADTIREILARVDKIALESGTEHLFENLDEILGIKREEDKQFFSDKSPIFSIGGLIVELGNPNKKVNITSASNFIEIDFTGKEVLDRAHWAYGEGGGLALEYYAHAINNLKKHGYWGPANKPYATEEEMKKSGWRDATHSYASGNIQTVNVHYKKFNEIRNDKSKFNTFIGATISLKATLKAILGYSEDTTNGAYQWIGGVGEVSPLDTTPEKYNAKDVVTIVTKTEFATYYHSFYKFAKE